MRLRTTWTIPAMSVWERLRRTREWMAMEVGSRLPLRVRYWTAMQEIAHATRDSKDTMVTPLDEVLKSLRHPKVMS